MKIARIWYLRFCKCLATVKIWELVLPSQGNFVSGTVPKQQLDCGSRVFGAWRVRSMQRQWDLRSSSYTVPRVAKW